MSGILKGENYTTGTVHAAKHTDRDASGRRMQTTHLIQRCGAARNQTAFLRGTAADVSCRKCLAILDNDTARTTTTASAPRPAIVLYGPEEYTITDLREIAKDLAVKGRTTMSGEQLYAIIVPALAAHRAS